MELSLDDAEAAFLKDVLSGAEALGGANGGAGSPWAPSCQPVAPACSPPQPRSAFVAAAPRLNDAPAGFLQPASSSRGDAPSAVTGRPPLPRSTQQAARSPHQGASQFAEPTGPQQLPQRHLANNALVRPPPERAPHQQHPYPHPSWPACEEPGPPASHGALSTSLHPGLTRRPSCSLSDCSSGNDSGAGSTPILRPRSATAAWTLPAASPPRASSSLATAPSSGPALSSNHSATSGSSEPESSSATLPPAGIPVTTPRSGAAASKRATSRKIVSSGAALVPTSGWARDRDPASAPGPASAPALAPVPAAGAGAAAPAAAATPSRRARALLQQIRSLESQLQHLLQVEAEAAEPARAAPGPRAASPTAILPDPGVPPAGAPAALPGRNHHHQHQHHQHDHDHVGGPPHAVAGQPADLAAPVVAVHTNTHMQAHTAMVYALAEQLCRDYNSSGVALMEAGLDGAARQQLDKALLLAGPGGPLEGRPDKQREMQIVAHNNLACYHRKLQQPQLALEHLQQAARLETASAGAGALVAGDSLSLRGPAGSDERGTPEPPCSGTSQGLVQDGCGRASAAVGRPVACLREPGAGCSSTGAGCGQGPTTATLLNLAACCGSLGQHQQALAYAEQALASAAWELQVALPPLEAALLQGLPQVQLWEVLPQLRRAEPATTSQLAMAYYNRAVEQEHLQMWHPALESYRMAVDVAGRFTGRGSSLTLTMQQSAEAFKARLRRLEKQGKLRARGASSSTFGSEPAAPSAAPATLPPTFSSSSSPSSAAAITPRYPQPRPHLRILRCTSSSTPSTRSAPSPAGCKSRPAAGPPPPPPPPRRRLPALARGPLTPPDAAAADAAATCLPAAVCTVGEGGRSGDKLAATPRLRSAGAAHAPLPASAMAPYGPVPPAGWGPPRGSSLQSSPSPVPSDHASDVDRQTHAEGGVVQALGPRGPASPPFDVPSPYTALDHRGQVPPEALLAGPGPPLVGPAVEGARQPQPGASVLSARQTSGRWADGVAAGAATLAAPPKGVIRMDGEADAPSVGDETRSAPCSGTLLEWEGVEWENGGSPRKGLAIAAAAAAAATAELARVCEEEEDGAVCGGELGLAVVGPGPHWHGSVVTSGGCGGDMVLSAPQPSPAPPLPVKASEGSGSGGGERRVHGSGQALTSRSTVGTNMLLPKRDGVAV